MRHFLAILISVFVLSLSTNAFAYRGMGCDRSMDPNRPTDGSDSGSFAPPGNPWNDSQNQDEASQIDQDTDSRPSSWNWSSWRDAIRNRQAQRDNSGDDTSSGGTNPWTPPGDATNGGANPWTPPDGATDDGTNPWAPPGGARNGGHPPCTPPGGATDGGTNPWTPRDDASDDGSTTPPTPPGDATDGGTNPWTPWTPRDDASDDGSTTPPTPPGDATDGGTNPWTPRDDASDDGGANPWTPPGDATDDNSGSDDSADDTAAFDSGTLTITGSGFSGSAGQFMGVLCFPVDTDIDPSSITQLVNVVEGAMVGQVQDNGSIANAISQNLPLTLVDLTLMAEANISGGEHLVVAVIDNAPSITDLSGFSDIGDNDLVAYTSVQIDGDTSLNLDYSALIWIPFNNL